MKTKKGGKDKEIKALNHPDKRENRWPSFVSKLCDVRVFTSALLKRVINVLLRR